MLTVGQKGKQSLIVTKEQTAQMVGSGELAVFATPSLVSLVEKTAWRSIASKLDKSQTTVGSKIELTHLAPTPISLQVWCETKLIEIDRKRLVFEAIVYDETDTVAQGIHERFIVDKTAFSAKANQKLH